MKEPKKMWVGDVSMSKRFSKGVAGNAFLKVSASMALSLDDLPKTRSTFNH